MKWFDVFQFTFTAVNGHRLRTALTLLAMSIGVAAVVVLTALGQGARNYISGEFASLGTNLLTVLPGRSETTGGSPAMFVGETPRDLTLDDALALKRHHSVKRVAPMVIGSAPVSRGGLSREVPTMGSSADLIYTMRVNLAQGSFLPDTELTQSSPVVVLGNKLKNELFGNESALGEWVRIGDRRFRVIGVLAQEGRSIGMDVEDIAIIPVSNALALYNSPSLFRVFVETRHREDRDAVKEFILKTIRDRHQGEEDITVMSPDAILKTFDNILYSLTMGVAGIAAISLAVAGILVMNVMLISVSQRTAEIGLLKSLGAPPRQIKILFLSEAVVLSLLGSFVGVIIGYIGTAVVGGLYPEFPAQAPLWAVLAAISVAMITGLIFGVSPAKRAAALDPVQALSKH